MAGAAHRTRVVLVDHNDKPIFGPGSPSLPWMVSTAPPGEIIVAVANQDLLAVGNGPDIDVGPHEVLSCSFVVTKLSGGVSPSVQFLVQSKDANGFYTTIYTSGALSLNGAVPVSIGPGCATNHTPGRTVRIAWVLSGGPTVAIGALSVIGK